MKNPTGKVFWLWLRSIFGRGDCIFLDEPEAALSSQRQLTLLLDIHNCASCGSQFVIATHSPILLGLPGAEILCFDQGPLKHCSYEETEAYQVMEMFINNRSLLLQHLLEEK